ncbi:Uncharacterised protein [[Eubacterium] contortum]|uniref:Uncharacterized protein n=1 Tax=Faecalicatena contorta TaxID=39482 RepID=A0A174JIN5_9FIRM|nr:phage head-tail connector protein [Faecalicatena contorta]CUO99594.1 Uncharacterised protein [[Eubacterium] contortum] [Faecalicatena contorta]
MGIQNEICTDLLDELNIVKDSDETIMTLKVKNAINEIINRRSYPSHFTNDDIERDLKKLYSNIHDLALYDYNQIGAEGQTSHSSNGTSRTWKDREDCLKGVFAWAGF